MSGLLRFFPFLSVINGSRMCIDRVKLCLCWFQVAENGVEITQKRRPTVKEGTLWFCRCCYFSGFCCFLVVGGGGYLFLK